MCGVVGFSTKIKPNQNQIDFLWRLIWQSKIRGLHSFGFSYYDDKIVTNKYHDLINLNLPLANNIIYHNRYSTSGDYKKHINNQPIESEDISLVFNGVLDMATKQEMEAKYNIKMQTDNDGEIIIRKCGKDKNKIKQFVCDTKGSFAGLMLTTDNKLYAIRNANRPLWRLLHNSATYYASTEDIFLRVDPNLKPEQLTPNKLYEN